MIKKIFKLLSIAVVFVSLQAGFALQTNTSTRVGKNICAAVSHSSSYISCMYKAVATQQQTASRAFALLKVANPRLTQNEFDHEVSKVRDHWVRDALNNPDHIPDTLKPQLEEVLMIKAALGEMTPGEAFAKTHQIRDESRAEFNHQLEQSKVRAMEVIIDKANRAEISAQSVLKQAIDKEQRVLRSDEAALRQSRHSATHDKPSGIGVGVANEGRDNAHSPAVLVENARKALNTLMAQADHEKQRAQAPFFHLAKQIDPSLSQKEFALALSTNVGRVISSHAGASTIASAITSQGLGIPVTQTVVATPVATPVVAPDATPVAIHIAPADTLVPGAAAAAHVAALDEEAALDLQ